MSTHSELDLLRNENNALRQQLETLSEQLAAGMNKPAFEQSLVKQPIAYALAGAADSQQDYQNLLKWLRQQASVFHAQPDALETDKYHLHEAWLKINAELNALRERLAASRWPQVRRHVPATENIRIQVERCWQQADQALIRQQELLRDSPLSRLARPLASQELPPPRPLSALHPTYMSIAGDDEKPIFMENVSELGDTALYLDSPQAHISFTLYCTENDFYRIDVLFGTCLRANACHLRLIIRAVNARACPTDVLRVVHFDGLEVLDNQFFPLAFEPLADSAGKSYWIEIDAPDARTDTALALWCHKKQPPLEVGRIKANLLAPYPPHKSEVWRLSQQFPQFLQKILLDAPLSPRLDADQPQHVFLLQLDGIDNTALSLHLFLLQLARMLDSAQQTAQVWLCGMLSPGMMEYVLKTHLLHICPKLHWVERVQAVLVLQQTAWQKADVLVWNTRLSAFPEADMLSQALRLFAENTQAALLLPVEIDAQENILSAYTLPGRDGQLLFPAQGDPVDTPQHRYRRTVQAAQDNVFILRSSALHHINWAQVAAYESDAYQSSDLIQQLQETGWTALYQACLRYVGKVPQTAQKTSTEDAKRFSRHWAKSLLNHLSPLATKAQCINPHRRAGVLVINDTLPEYDQDSASLRLYTLLKLWSAEEYQISFIADNADTEPHYRRALEDLGIEVFCGSHRVQQAMAWRQFAIALICRVEVGHRYIPFVRLLSPETRIYYDTVDIHYIREQRQADIEQDTSPRGSLATRAKAEQTKRKELHNCRFADEVITVTPEDCLHLQKDLPWLRCQVIPNIHSRPTQTAVPFAQRQGLVFIGNYKHAPNEDAVYYFVKNVLPLILQQLPEVKFYILGSHLSDKMREWACSNPHLDAIGWVEDVEAAFAQRKVFVSYLRYGAGMKGKLGQAMALGLPIVTTRMGAEGMGLQDAETALLADEPQAFADAVCRLYQDAELWHKLSAQGQDYIEQHYGESAVAKQLQKLLA